ncbi:hypothetical protein [Thermodesulfitimonas sp.]
MNQKQFKRTMLVLFFAVLAVTAGYFILDRKPVPPAPNLPAGRDTRSTGQVKETPPASQVKRPTAETIRRSPAEAGAGEVDWEGLIPAIRATLGPMFLGVRLEEVYPLRIYQTSDVTGDGVKEALVNLGTGGAYTEYLTLMMVQDDKVVAARFRRADGTVSPLIFPSGASVRHGEDVTMLPAKNAILTASWSTDESGKVDRCEVVAYRWDPRAQLFAFNPDLSNAIKPDYCRNLRLGGNSQFNRVEDRRE